MARFLLVIFLSLTSYFGLNGQTPAVKVFTAVKTNDINDLKTLFDQGADPNSYDEDGDHLLMCAALYSSIDCMRLLIEKGCNVNAKNGLDETALMWAVHDLEKMKLLIERGADVLVIHACG